MNNIEALLQKPLWQLTVKEFCEVSRQNFQEATKEFSSSSVNRITGVRALAEYMGCCESTVYMLLRKGALCDSIISRIGKKIVFDGDKARELGAAYQNTQRGYQKTNHASN